MMSDQSTPDLRTALLGSGLRRYRAVRIGRASAEGALARIIMLNRPEARGTLSDHLTPALRRI
jgi:hypothetical protein